MKLFSHLLGMIILFLGCTLCGMEQQFDANHLKADTEEKLAVLCQYYLGQSKTWSREDLQLLYEDIKAKVSQRDDNDPLISFGPQVGLSIQELYAGLDKLFNTSQKPKETSQKPQEEASDTSKGSAKAADPGSAPGDASENPMRRKMDPVTFASQKSKLKKVDEEPRTTAAPAPSSPLKKSGEEDEWAVVGSAKKRPVIAPMVKRDVFAEKAKEVLDRSTSDFEKEVVAWHDGLKKEVNKSSYYTALFTALLNSRADPEANKKLSCLMRYYLSQLGSWPTSDFNGIYTCLLKIDASELNTLDSTVRDLFEKLTVRFRPAGLLTRTGSLLSNLSGMRASTDKVSQCAQDLIKGDVDEFILEIDPWHNGLLKKKTRADYFKAAFTMLCNRQGQSEEEEKLSILCRYYLGKIGVWPEENLLGVYNYLRRMGETKVNNPLLEEIAFVNSGTAGSVVQLYRKLDISINPLLISLEGTSEDFKQSLDALHTSERADVSKRLFSSVWNQAKLCSVCATVVPAGVAQASHVPPVTSGSIPDSAVSAHSPGLPPQAYNIPDAPPPPPPVVKRTYSAVVTGPAPTVVKEPVQGKQPSPAGSGLQLNDIVNGRKGLKPAKKTVAQDPGTEPALTRGGSVPPVVGVFSGAKAPAKNVLSGSAAGIVPAKKGSLKVSPKAPVVGKEPAKVAAVEPIVSKAPAKKGSKKVAADQTKAGLKSSGSGIAAPKITGSAKGRPVPPGPHSSGTPTKFPGKSQVGPLPGPGVTLSSTPAPSVTPPAVPGGIPAPPPPPPPHPGFTTRGLGGNPPPPPIPPAPTKPTVNPGSPPDVNGGNNPLKNQEQLSVSTVLAVTAAVGLGVWAFKTYYWDPRHKTQHDIVLGVY